MLVTPYNPTNNKPYPRSTAGISLVGLAAFLLLLFTGVSPFFGIHHSLSKDFKHRVVSQHVSAGYHSTTGNAEGKTDLFLEVAEEDDIPDEYQIHGLQQKNFSHHEWGYSSFINALYLQLSFSLQRQAEEPIFVLNHSWRSHLS